MLKKLTACVFASLIAFANFGVMPDSTARLDSTIEVVAVGSESEYFTEEYNKKFAGIKDRIDKYNKSHSLVISPNETYDSFIDKLDSAAMDYSTSRDVSQDGELITWVKYVEGYVYSNYVFLDIGGEAVIIGYIGIPGEVILPKTIEGKPVIGAYKGACGRVAFDEDGNMVSSWKNDGNEFIYAPYFFGLDNESTGTIESLYVPQTYQVGIEYLTTGKDKNITKFTFNPGSPAEKYFKGEKFIYELTEIEYDWCVIENEYYDSTYFDNYRRVKRKYKKFMESRLVDFFEIHSFDDYIKKTEEIGNVYSVISDSDGQKTVFTYMGDRSGDYVYADLGSEVLLIAYLGNEKNIVLPKEINGKPVIGGAEQNTYERYVFSADGKEIFGCDLKYFGFEFCPEYDIYGYLSGDLEIESVYIPDSYIVGVDYIATAADDEYEAKIICDSGSPAERYLKGHDFNYQIINQRGDINGDNSVNAADITALIAGLKGDVEYPLSKVDLNHDGAFNAADITALISILKGND